MGGLRGYPSRRLRASHPVSAIFSLRSIILVANWGYRPLSGVGILDGGRRPHEVFGQPYEPAGRNDIRHYRELSSQKPCGPVPVPLFAVRTGGLYPYRTSTPMGTGRKPVLISYENSLVTAQASGRRTARILPLSKAAPGRYGRTRLASGHIGKRCATRREPGFSEVLSCRQGPVVRRELMQERDPWFESLAGSAALSQKARALGRC
jgi:hypothetical protein